MQFDLAADVEYISHDICICGAEPTLDRCQNKSNEEEEEELVLESTSGREQPQVCLQHKKQA